MPEKQHRLRLWVITSVKIPPIDISWQIIGSPNPRQESYRIDPIKHERSGRTAIWKRKTAHLEFGGPHQLSQIHQVFFFLNWQL
jgi:hypothetical protein